ncbi:MAG: hypothetical protein Ta2A_25880 [Treponemataceae bacterium]|nr:MAG: hypothetical protein Ta2A_25880 [Treponemataceae bacterium]
MNIRKLLFTVGVALCFCLMLTACTTEGGEKVVTILRLPDTPEFSNQDNHFDIGIVYKQDKFLGFLTFSNYDERWCLVYSKEIYAAVDKEVLDEIAKQAGLKMPEKMEIPLIDRISAYFFGTLMVLFFGCCIIISIKEKLEKKKAKS